MFKLANLAVRAETIGRKLSYLGVYNSKRSLNESGAYDGDGRTTVTVLNNDSKILLVNSFGTHGFRLSTEMIVYGSIILFPTHVYSWSVNHGHDITPESLRVFDLIVPRIKMLIIGYGSKKEKVDTNLAAKLRSKGFSCEILPTQNAVTTYNYLANDGVHVAGAFVTVKYFEAHQTPTSDFMFDDDLASEEKFTKTIETK